MVLKVLILIAYPASHLSNKILFPPYDCLLNITGVRMKERPIAELMDGLKQLGCRCELCGGDGVSAGYNQMTGNYELNLNESKN